MTTSLCLCFVHRYKLKLIASLNQNRIQHSLSRNITNHWKVWLKAPRQQLDKKICCRDLHEYLNLFIKGTNFIFKMPRVWIGLCNHQFLLSWPVSLSVQGLWLRSNRATFLQVHVLTQVEFLNEKLKPKLTFWCKVVCLLRTQSRYQFL